MKKYTPSDIESRWQAIWKEKGIFSPDLDKAEKPYYSLMMFPYPSAEGLHVGNAYAFCGSDIFSRFKRMQGYDVFEPIGLDGFGIHGENYALKIGEHPMEVSKRTEKHFYEQFKAIGNAYDWQRTIDTYKPEYYKWTQWAFLQLYKKGLAYRKKAEVNWCPSCMTVLADEQVISGECERCSTAVVRKDLEQWFFKITDYADRLLEGLEKIDWSERVKVAQRNWIGRAEDTEIVFSVVNSDLKITILTTRPDTIFGATFLVLAPEHELIQKFKEKIQNWDEVRDYIEKTKQKNDFERGMVKDKTGARLEGIAVINPATGKEVPVYTADFVLGTYGTGAVMAVPGHDDRDFAFARKFNLPIVEVVKRLEKEDILRVYLHDADLSDVAQSLRELGQAAEYWTPTQRQYNIQLQNASKIAAILKRAAIGTPGQHEFIKQGEAFALEMEPAIIDFGMVYSGDGVHVNSEFLNGLYIKEAKEKVLEWLKKKGVGKESVHYHLRDWLISRQRYWGPPIPIIYCDKCGIVPVPEEDLPIELPYIKDFRPEGTGQSPLASDPDFVNTKCPKCGGMARRETDVSDNFLDSALYFFRYLTMDFADKFFVENRTKKWLPVDMYIGGAEHAVLHLLYSRFITMVFKDLGFIDFEEPFTRFKAHGLLLKNGAKISKSKGNVISPDSYIKEWGADTLRMYLMFLGPFEQGGDFRDDGISGIARFLNRVWNLSVRKSDKLLALSDSMEVEQIRHQTIKKVTKDIENLHFNTAIASLMEYVNFLYRQKSVSSEAIETLLLLLAPFAPHMTEELWQWRGPAGSVSRVHPRSTALAAATRGDPSSPSPLVQQQQGELPASAFVSIHQQAWPKFDLELAKKEKTTIVIQVNGKLRDKIEVFLGTNKEELEKLARNSKKVQEFLANKKIKQIIVVPDRLVNIVI